MRSFVLIALVIAINAVLAVHAKTDLAAAVLAARSKSLDTDVAAKVQSILQRRSENIDIAKFAQADAEMRNLQASAPKTSVASYTLKSAQKGSPKVQTLNPTEILDAYDPTLAEIGQPFNGFVGGGAYSATGTSVAYLTTAATNATGGVVTPVYAGYSPSKQIMTVNVGSNFNYWNATHGVLCFGAASALDSLNFTCYWQLGGVSAYQVAYSAMGLTDVVTSWLYNSILRVLQFTGLIPDISSPNRMGDLFIVDPLHGWWIRWIFTELFCEDFIGPYGSDYDFGSIYTTNIINLTNVVAGEPSEHFIGIPANLRQAYANARPVALIQNCGQT